MANNRLYLLDTKTGEACFLAKAMGDGWYTTEGTDERLDKFFSQIDPDTSKPMDWACSAGLPGFPTRIMLVDESTYDPDGMAAEKRRIVSAITSKIPRGTK
jgi:hypothetical protein